MVEETITYKKTGKK